MSKKRELQTVAIEQLVQWIIGGISTQPQPWIIVGLEPQPVPLKKRSS